MAWLIPAALALPLAAAPADAEPPTGKIPEQLLNPDAKNPTASREAVLRDLFDRLRGAEDEENAELIAAAIEKIWLQSGSDTVDLLMSRVTQLMQKEELDVALNILDSVVEIAPDYAEGWNRRATVLFLKRDFRRSLDDLRHVLALEPRHFKAINGLGLIMQELGDKKAALKAFRQALRVYPRLSETKQIERELAREVEGQGI